jgi:phage terminase large subunit GpA-like protein
MIGFVLETKLRASLVPRRLPSMLEWAKSTVVIPDGPLKGQHFDPDSQPFSRLFLEAVDSGQWDRIVATGPTQTGKSLICYVIPVLYHLLCVGESVVAGLPTGDMSDDKWKEDFLPVIESSPELHRLLPSAGQGSRAGRVRTRVKFRNGATLRFMTGGGSDKTRAGFTSRVLAVTEVDGLDVAGTTSREADKLKQLEARQRAFLSAGTRTYLECTVTTTKGRIWQEYIHGTESRIARPCPHCKVHVSPGRESLVGWEEAEDELQARAAAAWSCPACGELWTEPERHAANLKSVLVHRGQEVTPDGVVTGARPATRTLGFRWTAVDNHFATAADVAADEWGATREHDRDNAEKELCQFVHCIPHDPPDVDMTPLEVSRIVERTTTLKRGIIPADCVGISVGVDTNKRYLHWTAIAWLASGAGFVLDYGTQTVPWEKLGIKGGLLAALHTLKSFFDRGWQQQTGGSQLPSQVWIDSGYFEHTGAVYEFCHLANAGTKAGSERYRPSKGYGTGQRRMENYHVPKATGNEVRFIGPGYHLARIDRGKLMLVHVNSDHYKSELHQRLAMPADAAHALMLFETTTAAEHREFVEQLTAEKQVERWIEGKGEVTVWERVRKANHHLDATYAAVAAGDLILRISRKKAAKLKQCLTPQKKKVTYL